MNVEVKRVSYKEFLALDPSEVMQSGRPKVFCVRGAKLSSQNVEKSQDPSPMAGLVLSKGNVYLHCSGDGITMYERGIYQTILMISLKSENRSPTEVFTTVKNCIKPL